MLQTFMPDGSRLTPRDRPRRRDRTGPYTMPSSGGRPTPRGDAKEPPARRSEKSAGARVALPDCRQSHRPIRCEWRRTRGGRRARELRTHSVTIDAMPCSRHARRSWEGI
jgi:hypothetical protein